MRRQQQTLDLSRRLAAPRGLLRKDVGRRAEPTAFDLPQEFGEIDHPCPAHQQEHRARRDHLEFTFSKETLVRAGHRGEHDNDLACFQDLLERRRGDTEADHEMVGYPRIVGLDRAAEWREERREGARKIPKADEAHPRAVKREAALGAVETASLLAAPS